MKTTTRKVRALDEVVMVGCPDASEVPLPTTGATARSTKKMGILRMIYGGVAGSWMGTSFFLDFGLCMMFLLKLNWKNMMGFTTI